MLVATIDRSFKSSERTYGARRVWHDVLAEGLSCGLHRKSGLSGRTGCMPGRAAAGCRRMRVSEPRCRTTSATAPSRHRPRTRNGWPTSPVLPSASAGAAVESGMESRPRYIRRLAQLCHRPDLTVLDESEPHVASLAKSVAAFLRMSAAAFSLATSLHSLSILNCSSFIWRWPEDACETAGFLPSGSLLAPQS